MHQPVREGSVVGEDERARRVRVEPANREEPLRDPHELDDGPLRRQRRVLLAGQRRRRRHAVPRRDRALRPARCQLRGAGGAASRSNSTRSRPETVVYPGHGELTTRGGREKESPQRPVRRPEHALRTGPIAVISPNASFFTLGLESWGIFSQIKMPFRRALFWTMAFPPLQTSNLRLDELL